MLIQFMIKNVFSFREETVLDMTAIHAYKEHDYNLIKHTAPKGAKSEKFLKVAAIYGANASGKSNLCFAMQNFQWIVRESANNVGEDGKTILEQCYVPFAFEDHQENSEFQIIAMDEAAEYRYGFEYNAAEVVSEWLYRKDRATNREAIIFERMRDTIEFGHSVRKECDIYKEQIPSETLVLSFFERLKKKVGVFDAVYNEIFKILVMPSILSESPAILGRLLPKQIDKDKKELLTFLNAIDSGIKDIAYKKSANKKHRHEEEIEFYTTHIGKDGEPYDLGLWKESEGTIKSMILFLYAQQAIKYNKAIFADELNTKLHPLLLKFIIDLFYTADTEAQLIYTTHDTTLLDRSFFRRDQIWFVQKDEYGCSELTALSDFRVRSDASFEKDYLAGVYGGIPQLEAFRVKEGV